MKKRDIHGITLIALVITIIILLILAGVTIWTLTGENGVLRKSEKAEKENNKQTAAEIMNLKITDAQIKSYAETQTMPDLQYVANRLYEDNEIEYIKVKSKEIASLNEKVPVKIETEEDSILTKLNDYPYEFEIDGFLRLASIDGVKIADNVSEISEQIKQLQEQMKDLKNKGKTNLIERTWGVSKVNTSPGAWQKLEEVSLSGHGTGKAIISFSIANEKAATQGIAVELYKNNTMIAKDESVRATSNIGLSTSTSATVPYDEDTVIKFNATTYQTVTPSYTYSILLVEE